MLPLRRYLIVMGAIVAVAVLVRVAVDVPTGATLLVLLIAWPLVGTLVTADDDLPGGWSNPDGKATPEWRMSWWWADLILIRGSLVLSAFAIEEMIDGHPSVGLIVGAVTMFAIGLPIFVRGVRKEIAHAA